MKAFNISDDVGLEAETFVAKIKTDKTKSPENTNFFFEVFKISLSFIYYYKNTYIISIISLQKKKNWG